MQTVSIATLLHVYNLLINHYYLQTDRVIPILCPEGLILPAKKKNKFCIPYDGNKIMKRNEGVNKHYICYILRNVRELCEIHHQNKIKLRKKKYQYREVKTEQKQCLYTCWYLVYNRLNSICSLF